MLRESNQELRKDNNWLREKITALETQVEALLKTVESAIRELGEVSNGLKGKADLENIALLDTKIGEISSALALSIKHKKAPPLLRKI